MSSSSGLMPRYLADGAPSPAEQERLSARRKLQNLYFLMRNASVEAEDIARRLTDGADQLLRWLDANQHATRDEFQAQQEDIQSAMNELLLRQIEAAGKKRKLEDQ